MRQLLGPKKLRKYSRLLKRTFVMGWVRGNTGHRVDLQCDHGWRYSYYPDTKELELDVAQTVGWMQLTL